MNTKIIVALVLGIALVGLTGAASAGHYHIDGNYMYTDAAANAFDAHTDLEVILDGTGPAGNDIYMHTWVDNYMDVDSVSSDNSDVLFELVQNGVSALTIETGLPGNMNTFVSEDQATQKIDYVANGDAFNIGFYGVSNTHASTHEGILPIEEMNVWDYNEVNGVADASGYENENGVWVDEASIKSGNVGYVCETHGEAQMEAEHILGPVTAGSGIKAWSNAHGEIWEVGGQISNDIEAYQEVSMWWSTP